MKRFIFLCLASISLLPSCDYAPYVQNPLTSRKLDVTVSGVTATIKIESEGLYIDYDNNATGICWDTTPNPSLQSSFHKEWIWMSDQDGLYHQYAILENLQENTTYYLRSYISNPGSFVYGNEITFTTQSEYVDLGLSVKWGTTNVGTSIEFPSGKYFAWGEIDSKKQYDWYSYKWGTFDGDYTKYVTDSKYAFSTVDNKTVLDLEDDVAYVLSKHKAKIPTKEQWEELISSCDWKWEKQDNKYGYKVTSRINQNSIFLPALGYMSNSNWDFNQCYYWSKSLDTTNNARAWGFESSESTIYTIYGSSRVHKYETTTLSREYGLPVRAVYE